MKTCNICGMDLEDSDTYHPFAACLMYKAVKNADIVRNNLQLVVQHGIDIGKAEQESMCETCNNVDGG